MICVSSERIERLLAGERLSEELARLREHARGCDPCRAAVSEAAERFLVRRLALDGGHLDSDLLSRFVDDTEDGPARLLVEAHLDVCVFCRARVEAMYEGRFRSAAIARSVSYEPVLARPAPHRMPARSAWLVAGAAALSAAIVALLPGLIRRSVPAASPSGDPVAAARRDGKIILRDGPFELLAAAGGPVEWRGGDPDARAELEAFLPGGALRDLDTAAPDLVRGRPDPTGPRHDGAFPAPDQIVNGSSVRFRWDGSPGDRYAIEIATPDQKLPPLIRREVRGTTVTVTLAPLPPGQAYTWTVLRIADGEYVVMERGFRIADAAEARKRIAEWEHSQPPSHLLRAALYEKYGAFPEALAELRALARESGGNRKAAGLYEQRTRDLGAVQH